MTPSKPSPPGFWRKMDPQRDLNAVADLVEDAFELKQDPEGHAIVDSMRRHARLMAQSSNLLEQMILRASWANGLVWEHEGRVVGNITLIPHQKGLRTIIMVANVAVYPEYRGMGIARELTLQGLRTSQGQGVREFCLQVRRENDVAIRLYKSLGFVHHSSTSQWRMPASKQATGRDIPSQEGLSIQRRHFSDWQAQKQWLAESYPRDIRWYAALNFAALSPFAWFNPMHWGDLSQTDHYTLRRNKSLLGVLSWQGKSSPTDILCLALPQSADEDQSARHLLSHFLNQAWRGKKLQLDFPFGRASEGIQAAGFTLANNLDWMELKL